MSVVEKLAEIHDINNMATFFANHFRSSTHAPTNETHKTRYEVIAPPTTNLGLHLGFCQ